MATGPVNRVRDALGELREEVPFIIVSEPQQALVDDLYRSLAREIQIPDFAKTKDQEAWKKMRRDEVVAKAADQLLDDCAGTSWYLEPGDERSKPLVAYFRALLKRIPDFTSARRALGQGFFEGIAWARMLTPDVDRELQIADDTQPRKWWWPELVHIGADAIRRYQEPGDKQTDITGDAFEPPTWPWATHDPVTNRWLKVNDLKQYVRLSFQNDHHSKGYGHGMLGAMWTPWHIKKHLERQMAKGAKRFTFPWIGVQLDTKAMMGDGGGWRQRVRQPRGDGRRVAGPD